MLLFFVNLIIASFTYFSSYEISLNDIIFLYSFDNSVYFDSNFLFFKIDLPIVGNLTRFPIEGETEAIYYENERIYNDRINCYVVNIRNCGRNNCF